MELFGKYGYLLIYCIFFIVAVLTNTKRIKERSIVKLLLAIYVFFYTFRAAIVGFDYETYISVFEMSKRMDILTYLSTVSYMEKGFLILNKVVSGFGGSVYVLQFIIALIFVIAVYKFIEKYTDSSLMGLFLFYGMGCMFNLMNIQRSELAVAICMLAFISVDEKRWIKAVLLTVLAVSVHTSAIFGFVIIFLFFKTPKISTKSVVKATISIAIAVGLFDFILQKALAMFPRYKAYFSADKIDTFVKSGSISYVIVFLSVFAFAYYHRRTYIKSLMSKDTISGEVYNEQVSIDREIKVYDVLLWINVMGIAVSILSMNLSLINRCMFIPLNMICVLLTKAIRSISSASERFLTYIFIIICILGYSYIYLYMAENGLGRDGVVPYILWCQTANYLR